MIKLNEVDFSYQKKKPILKNINLEIPRGKITMVIGQNGSGKSTLCNVISNLLNYKGEITLDDKNIKKIPSEEFRKKVGIVFQNPNHQVLFNRIYDDMSFVINNLKLDNKDYRIKKALKLVEMEDFQDKNPYELSLGQKQRLALATTLTIEPDYLIFDEITAMIDDEGKQAIYKILEKLKADGKGILFSTNIMSELIYADEIIILYNGIIAKKLSQKELLTNIDILKDYELEVPFILKLINLLKTKNILLDDLKENKLLKILEEKL